AHRGAAALVEHDHPGRRPRRPQRLRVLSQRLAAVDRHPRQRGHARQLERLGGGRTHGRTTPPSAAKPSLSTSGSPTTTPVNRSGAKNSRAASTTCSVLTSCSRCGWPASHSTPSPAPASADNWDASPACDEVEISSDPDRKSTRLNSSHVKISYAVFCLKKKKKPYKVRVLP